MNDLEAILVYEFYLASYSNFWLSTPYNFYSSLERGDRVLSKSAWMSWSLSENQDVPRV